MSCFSKDPFARLSIRIQADSMNGTNGFLARYFDRAKVKASTKRALRAISIFLDLQIAELTQSARIV